ncbi:DoxX family protein [Dyadobacter fanqingshengii]|uniref:DoxX family protein n=1 Tax=Dyadobacter fanqingshengii TaxID=2906443 RepID=A0A9X1TAX2_9BACT|nr:DoxX family protein [Dyadobacter fanqingshengii]MCF0042231.1 DoxX family protein [Dyadobacter fanqingshengii]USJ35238.1 DoxX family protein [Dyadobacter fanqingshengii]
MNKINIWYWIFTIGFVLPLTAGSLFELSGNADSISQYTRLGYPAYLPPFLGLARLLAVIAIIVSGFPRLKEWAYAGLVFDVMGAAFSQIASGQEFTNALFPLITIFFIAGSYLLYHRRVALG